MSKIITAWPLCFIPHLLIKSDSLLYINFIIYKRIAIGISNSGNTAICLLFFFFFKDLNASLYSTSGVN